ncbi:MAG: (E)-4-hydroxy-3-methylbut-2-enyl-diphosphate synthase [Tidjanibacter sp.]|nr:(E)-4-hydroxy-3-methylbut-2-enyl-diphosphate synthase [Tidjanibacter sp.]
MFCRSLTHYSRRESSQVAIGRVNIGGRNPIEVQTMTNTDTLDTAASVAQIGRVAAVGGRIVRLTTQGIREAENLAAIAREVHSLYPEVALVADVHFLPQVAAVAALAADKVRINPGNYNDRGGNFVELLELCRRRGVALRIGVNHGSLAPRMVEQYGDTPEGMVASAMEFLRVCKANDFSQVVVSMKSSNVVVMVSAYRQLVEAMGREQMNYPLHLGVTEAGNSVEGRIKSAVGIGALLSDGIGDTIRVSLTEAPENEIPVAQLLAAHYQNRIVTAFPPIGSLEGLRRDEVPVLWSEVPEGRRRYFDVVDAVSDTPVQEWRSKLGNRRSKLPVMLRRHYKTMTLEQLRIEAAADFGVMFIDRLADGIDLSADGIPEAETDAIALDILQSARRRITKPEYIACPSCGRTLYDIESVLDEIKQATSHLSGVKIAVMGCIVNGPGEMADADYGYVGASRGCITLYRAGKPVEYNIPQEEAIGRLVELIRADSRWTE